MTDAQNTRASLLKLAPGSTDATREGVEAFSALVQKIYSKAGSASGSKKLLDAKVRAYPIRMRGRIRAVLMRSVSWRTLHRQHPFSECTPACANTGL